METPEKLYLIQHNGLICYCRNNNNDIEYTRTDAFTEKAISWLKEQEEMVGISFQEDFIERFKKYMEE
jgi:hypothetical protein